MSLTEGDFKIVEEARAKNNLSIFTNYYFRPPSGGYSVFPTTRRHKLYMERWEGLGKPEKFLAESGEIRFNVVPKMVRNDLIFQEERGYVFLPWFLDFLRSPQQEKLVIGAPGVGKTQQVGIAALAMAAIYPNFRFLNVAPLAYQAGLMVTEIESIWEKTLFREKWVLPGIKGFKKKPYPKIILTNGSTLEFMNVEKTGAKNIQSWSGDWIDVEEAGLLNELDAEGRLQLEAIMIGIVTRLRGTDFQTGRPRMGLISMITMAYENDYIWQLFDQGMENPEERYVRKVFRKSNPFLSEKDEKAFLSHIPPGKEKMWLNLEPMPVAGAEFTPQMLEGLYNPDLLVQAQQPDSGVIVETGRNGIWHYEEPYKKDHVYAMAGDPGISDPPNRNAPNIQVYDVTDFPKRKARLAMFWWGYPNGSYMPFIDKFKSSIVNYKVPMMYCGYDSTSTQKMMAELAWMSDGLNVLGLGFDAGKKMDYLNAAKMLMSKRLVEVPGGIKWFEAQMKSYRLPDHKMAQDIVATFSMAMFLIYPLYLADYPEDPDAERYSQVARFANEATRRYSRSSTSRWQARRS